MIDIKPARVAITPNDPHIGSSFESFLEEEGILDDCTTVAFKRVLDHMKALVGDMEVDLGAELSPDDE